MKLEPANIACPVCGNSNYMRHLIGNNIGYYDTKCLNYLSYFNYEEIAAEALDGKDINVTTNADRIRAMANDELAIWLCENIKVCAECIAEEFCKPTGEQANGMLEWLKQEVKEEEK